MDCRKGTTLILDGGMSRELMRLGAPFRQPEWSALALLEGPRHVQQAHQDFISAGADIVTTNSYALVPFHIGEQRFQDRGEELAKLAGTLARRSVDEHADSSARSIFVAGSLPPIFGSYEPERFDAEHVQDYLGVLVRGLAPSVDIWLGETLSLIAEARAVIEAVKSTGKPIWVSFTLDDRNEAILAGKAQSHARLRSGETVAEATHWAVEAKIDGLLFNCSEPEIMGQAVRTAKAILLQHGSDIPVGVYANAFSKVAGDGAANEDIAELRKEMTTEAYLTLARQWHADGATIIGGCCGIGKEYIKALSQDLKTPTAEIAAAAMIGSTDQSK